MKPCESDTKSDKLICSTKSSRLFVSHLWW